MYIYEETFYDACLCSHPPMAPPTAVSQHSNLFVCGPVWISLAHRHFTPFAMFQLRNTT